jgi:hypothetical protein
MSCETNDNQSSVLKDGTSSKFSGLNWFLRGLVHKIVAPRGDPLIASHDTPHPVSADAPRGLELVGSRFRREPKPDTETHSMRNLSLGGSRLGS